MAQPPGMVFVKVTVITQVRATEQLPDGHVEIILQLYELPQFV